VSLQARIHAEESSARQVKNYGDRKHKFTALLSSQKNQRRQQSDGLEVVFMRTKFQLNTQFDVAKRNDWE